VVHLSKEPSSAAKRQTSLTPSSAKRQTSKESSSAD
jgi:hypothetical protein